MALRRHLRILAGGTEEQAVTTKSWKVAFASSDRKRVDQHFGSASALVTYAVTTEQATLVEMAQFSELEQDGHEGKLAAKLALLKDCAAVYCQAVGGSAIQQLLAIGVQPVRVVEGVPITRLLAELQAALRADVLPWANTVRQRQNNNNPDRFAAMEAEGWQE